MHSSMYKYIKRDEIMRRDKVGVENAKKNLTVRGFSLKEATHKIKKAVMSAIKEKTFKH